MSLKLLMVSVDYDYDRIMGLIIIDTMSGTMSKKKKDDDVLVL